MRSLNLSNFFFMCWSKNFIFCILPAVGCELSNEMHSSRSLAMKQTARQAIGTECQSHCCGKMFGTLFAFDQHQLVFTIIAMKQTTAATACSTILLPQPVQQQFDFASFMRCSGANTTTLLSVIREADAHLPPGPIVIYSERAGGAVRLNILHIKHIMHIVKLQLRPLQNPSSQAANLLALASTFGTEPRFDASLHTLWLEVAVTTWVIML